MVQNKEQHNAKTKKLAIKYYLKKEISQKKVSEIFNVNPRTFRRWLEAYNDNEKLDDQKDKINLTKLNVNMWIMLSNY